MAERSKALRSGRSPLLWAWVRIPLLTNTFLTKVQFTAANTSTNVLAKVPLFTIYGWEGAARLKK